MIGRGLIFAASVPTHSGVHPIDAGFCSIHPVRIISNGDAMSGASDSELQPREESSAIGGNL